MYPERNILIEHLQDDLRQIPKFLNTRNSIDLVCAYLEIIFDSCNEFLENFSENTIFFWGETLQKHLLWYRRRFLPSGEDNLWSEEDKKILRFLRRDVLLFVEKILEFNTQLEKSLPIVQLWNIRNRKSHIARYGRDRWWWKLSRWGSMWTILSQWSYTAIARKEYDCNFCGQLIYVWERYTRKVIRMGEYVEVIRKHIDCPSDPVQCGELGYLDQNDVPEKVAA